MKKTIQRVAVIAALMAAAALIGAFVFLATPATLMPEASAALRSSESVEFSEAGGWLTFTPLNAEPQAGVIFYPGGRVPPAAYAPAMRAIAEQGYLTVIVPMPLNLALLNVEGAAPVQAAYPAIKRWAIGGHSLGGVAAVEYAAKNPGAVQGLYLWASYANSNVSGQPLAALSVYGALENTRADYISAQAQSRLPAGAVFVAIAGGNHEQFGYYTGQPGDAVPQTAREVQQAQVVEATLALLAKLTAR